MSLRHALFASALACLAIAAPAGEDKGKNPPKPPPWYTVMDYGPFLLDTITGKGGDVAKGLAIPLGADGAAGGICYDLDLLRVSAAWTGGFPGHNGGGPDPDANRGP